jgi:hypothetical protein
MPITTKKTAIEMRAHMWYEFKLTKPITGKWIEFSFSATKLKKYYGMKFTGETIADSLCPLKVPPKVVVGESLMTDTVKKAAKDGQMWVNNYNVNAFYQVDAHNYFDACLLAKDNYGKDATWSIRTIKGKDDSKPVADSTVGEIFYNK